ncbi:MAG: hypothetical protein DRN71_05895 [Candidatus Nanohalarchaeota archaeon]|nr:MAG: hypothetical protein DRN71_05895 [Candidatus Nanohaloarchaeota archaeon]
MTSENDSLLIEFLGDTPLIRVFDFLIVFREYDHNKQNIAKNSNVSWNTLDKIWDKLVDSSIIVHTRKVGKSQMFRINQDNVAVKKLIELHKSLMIESLKKMDSSDCDAPQHIESAAIV